jgi:hypothetical protein
MAVRRSFYMERKCTICGGTVFIDKDNSNRAIQYKKKFYHLDCFDAMCDQKIASKRKDVSSAWTEVKASIDELVAETTKEQRLQVAKDELGKWLLAHYDISFLSARLFMKLNDIYNGTFKGLAYPIGPIELSEEWQYYWNELCAIRRNKSIVGEGAINYDLTVLLSRNAEYRKAKEKERVAREVREQQKREETVVNVSAMKPKWQPKNKVADLYKEMNGGEDNE